MTSAAEHMLKAVAFEKQAEKKRGHMVALDDDSVALVDQWKRGELKTRRDVVKFMIQVAHETISEQLKERERRGKASDDH